MMKLAKEWWQILDGGFLIITGVSMYEMCFSLATYTVSELFTLDKVSSFVVSIVAIIFWLVRLKMIKDKNRKEQKILDLEIKIKEMYINRKDMEDEIKEFLDNEDKSRNL